MHRLTNIFYPRPQNIKNNKFINLNDFDSGEQKHLKIISTGVCKEEKNRSIGFISESLFWKFNKLNCNQVHVHVYRGVYACTCQQLLLLRVTLNKILFLKNASGISNLDKIMI